MKEYVVSQFSAFRSNAAPIAILAAALTACGGGGGDGTAAATGTTATTTTTTTTTTTLPSYSQLMTVEPAKTNTAGEFLVNPAATWKLFKDVTDGNVGAVATVDLRTLVPAGQTPEGKVFLMQALGTYNASSFSATAQIVNDMSALFVTASGVAVPMSTTTPGITMATKAMPCTATAGTDPYTGDFIVPALAAVQFTVPAGATHLRLSVDDCHFYDNVPTASDPLRLSIKLVTP